MDKGKGDSLNISSNVKKESLEKLSSIPTEGMVKSLNSMRANIPPIPKLYGLVTLS